MNTKIYERRVLIVEDSADMRSLLKLILEAEGYSIECRPNGEEALQSLKCSDVLPDLILLDLRMPIMDGHDFIREIKLLPKLFHIPIVIMSGDYDSEMSQSFISAGKLLRKPLSVATVIQTVAQNITLH